MHQWREAALYGCNNRPRGARGNPRRNAQIPEAVSHSRPGFLPMGWHRPTAPPRSMRPQSANEDCEVCRGTQDTSLPKYFWKPDQDCPKLSPPTQPRDPTVCYMPSRLPHRQIDPAGRLPVLDPGSISLAPRVLVNQTPKLHHCRAPFSIGTNTQILVVNAVLVLFAAWRVYGPFVSRGYRSGLFMIESQLPPIVLQ